MQNTQSNFDTLRIDCQELSCINRQEHDLCLVQTRMRQSTDSKISNYKQRNSPEQKKSAKNSEQNSGKNSATSDHILFRKLNCKLCSFIAAMPHAQSYVTRHFKSKSGHLQDQSKRSNTY